MDTNKILIYLGFWFIGFSFLVSLLVYLFSYSSWQMLALVIVLGVLLVLDVILWEILLIEDESRS